MTACRNHQQFRAHHHVHLLSPRSVTTSVSASTIPLVEEVYYHPANGKREALRVEDTQR
jgi:hypothetical protein